MNQFGELDEFRGVVKQFLEQAWRERRPEEPFPEVADETDLFGAGVLDSILTIELLLVLEDGIGTEIDIVDIDPASFFTIGGMHKFVAGVARSSGS